MTVVRALWRTVALVSLLGCTTSLDVEASDINERSVVHSGSITIFENLRHVEVEQFNNNNTDINKQFAQRTLECEPWSVLLERSPQSKQELKEQINRDGVVDKYVEKVQKVKDGRKKYKTDLYLAHVAVPENVDTGEDLVNQFGESIRENFIELARKPANADFGFNDSVNFPERWHKDRFLSWPQPGAAARFRMKLDELDNPPVGVPDIIKMFELLPVIEAQTHIGLDRADWTFVTHTDKTAGFLTPGAHPVNGVRQFGFRKIDDRWFFYSKGLLRLSPDIIPGFRSLPVDVYERGDEYWTNVFKNAETGDSNPDSVRWREYGAIIGVEKDGDSGVLKYERRWRPDIFERQCL